MEAPCGRFQRVVHRMAAALTCWQQALAQHDAVLRPLAGAFVYAAIVLVWRRPLGRWAAVALALAISGLVLAGAWVAFLAMAAAVYAAVAAASKSSRPALWTRLLLVTLAVVFVVARGLGWDRQAPFLFDVHVGLYYLDMWMLLRLFTFIWEVGGGLVPLPDVAGYAAWVANPLLLGGPLVRLSHWPTVIAGNRGALGAAGWKIGLEGAAMVAAGVSMEAAAIAAREILGPDAVAVKAASVLVIGPWTFYLTVGGLYRLIEWLAGWCGVEVPVSFRLPFFRSNIVEFWARWNLTATAVFRDYFFYNRWGLRRYNVFVNTMIVFVAVGLWHGSNVYWLTFGVLHGLFFCAYLWSRGRLGPLQGRRWFEYGSIALTYVAVCAAWYVPSKISFLLTRR